MREDFKLLSQVRGSSVVDRGKELLVEFGLGKPTESEQRKGGETKLVRIIDLQRHSNISPSPEIFTMSTVHGFHGHSIMRISAASHSLALAWDNIVKCLVEI